ncbi:MAG TPA: hypothetical protein VJN18_04085 [Polyangiaceae bacterium]|nr:hypothetical protein [Polyangiaceae bacterium]
MQALAETELRRMGHLLRADVEMTRCAGDAYVPVVEIARHALSVRGVSETLHS